MGIPPPPLCRPEWGREGGVSKWLTGPVMQYLEGILLMPLSVGSVLLYEWDEVEAFLSEARMEGAAV